MVDKNKVCVVTGGANGIGRALVMDFAAKGATVAFVDKDRVAGERLYEKIQSDGCRGLFFCGDLRYESTITDFAKKVIDTFGHVDYLLNNACFSNRGIHSDCSYDDFNDVLHVGVTAPYMLAKCFLAHFAKNASIVNVASTRAMMSQADTESYSATKGGIVALTHALAASLAGKVRVNCVSPGWIDTKSNETNEHSEADRAQHWSYRVGTVQDIVRIVRFLCDEQNGFINGQNIIVDGGMSKQMIYHGDQGWTYEGK